MRVPIMTSMDIVSETAEARARARDFDTFFKTETDAVYRALAATLRDADLAEEAAAEAMARAYQHWRRIRAYDNPAGWVYRVGLNWATSRLRRRDVRRRLARPAGVEDATPFDPALHRALLGLDLDQRAVVVLRYLFDWSQDQIAAALAIPVGTVKSRLGRGVAKLRAGLEDER